MWLFKPLPLDRWPLYYFQIVLELFFWHQQENFGLPFSVSLFLCIFHLLLLLLSKKKKKTLQIYHCGFLIALFPYLYSLVAGLSTARLCRKESGVLFTVPEVWVAEQGQPHNCTIMGIQDDRVGSHKISGENEARQHPGKTLSNERQTDRNQGDSVLPVEIDRWFVSVLDLEL